jgi:hypothetical protein
MFEQIGPGRSTAGSDKIACLSGRAAMCPGDGTGSALNCACLNETGLDITQISTTEEVKLPTVRADQ